MKATKVYSEKFYSNLMKTSKPSSCEIVPYIMHLVRPDSVVDVGCGMGSWLSTFSEHGVEHVLGIDGYNVDVDHLEIPKDRFIALDLSKAFTVEERFDLVVSLEVAEHLPGSSAEDFVSSLTSLGDCILFSAAVPGQPGVNHINCQWLDYWVSLFADRNFKAVDCLRLNFWDNKKVNWWYSQNMMLFVAGETLSNIKSLSNYRSSSFINAQAIVHPGLYEQVLWEARSWRVLSTILNEIPQGELFVLIDDSKVSGYFGDKFQFIQFPMQGSTSWPRPMNSAVAVSEIETAVYSNSSYLTILWTAFWWLDYYEAFSSFLHEKYSQIYFDEDVIIFKKMSRY